MTLPRFHFWFILIIFYPLLNETSAVKRGYVLKYVSGSSTLNYNST